MTERSKRMLADLDDRARPAFDKFLCKLDDKLDDQHYIAFEGRRALAVQEAYFAQGRGSLELVNEKRRRAGLYLLRSEKDNYIITWTLDSMHIRGLAMDVLPADAAGNPTWDLAHYMSKFIIIRDCARECGLVCGADWKPADWPHYEIRI
jgi:hypothetical protein